MTQEETRLTVDVLLPSAIVTGTLSLTETRRLVDVLNGGDPALQLSNVTLLLAGERDGRRLPSFAVEKKRVLIAMPRETPEQVRLRQIYRTGIAPMQASPLPVCLLLPPYYVEGTARLTPGAASRLEPGVFQQFFVLTDASIWREDGARRNEPVIVVARDQIAGLTPGPQAHAQGG